MRQFFEGRRGPLSPALRRGAFAVVIPEGHILTRWRPQKSLSIVPRMADLGEDGRV